MKKYVIIVAAFIVLGIVALAIPMWIRYDYIQYEKDIQAHVLSCSKGDLITEYKGEKTKVLGQNISKLQTIITVSERSLVFFRPRYDPETAVKLVFPDEAELVIVEDSAKTDKIYIFYHHQSANRCYAVEGYDAFKWITEAISPEGIYQANELITE
ncbi:MAG: hypothetical protein VB070_13245 [Clostridiaceae bacterium]|nr:hypothetical protein [Clostridiaceae bacterium]